MFIAISGDRPWPCPTRPPPPPPLQAFNSPTPCFQGAHSQHNMQQNKQTPIPVMWRGLRSILNTHRYARTSKDCTEGVGILNESLNNIVVGLYRLWWIPDGDTGHLYS